MKRYCGTLITDNDEFSLYIAQDTYLADEADKEIETLKAEIERQNFVIEIYGTGFCDQAIKLDRNRRRTLERVKADHRKVVGEKDDEIAIYKIALDNIYNIASMVLNKHRSKK